MGQAGLRQGTGHLGDNVQLQKYRGFFFNLYGSIYSWLVVSTPLKNMLVSWDYYSQNMGKKCSKPPTSIYNYIYYINKWDARPENQQLFARVDSNKSSCFNFSVERSSFTLDPSPCWKRHLNPSFMVPSGKCLPKTVERSTILSLGKSTISTGPCSIGYTL